MNIESLKRTARNSAFLHALVIAGIFLSLTSGNVFAMNLYDKDAPKKLIYKHVEFKFTLINKAGSKKKAHDIVYWLIKEQDREENHTTCRNGEKGAYFFSETFDKSVSKDISFLESNYFSFHLQGAGVRPCVIKIDDLNLKDNERIDVVVEKDHYDIATWHVNGELRCRN